MTMGRRLFFCDGFPGAQRLSCRMCGVPLSRRQGSRGPLPDYCGRACRLSFTKHATRGERQRKIRARVDYSKKPRPTKCLVCESEFVTHWNGGLKRRKYCSPDCAYEGNKRVNKGRRYPRKPHWKGGQHYPIHALMCQVCGGPFQSKLSRQKTCGYECGYVLLRRYGAAASERRRAAKQRPCQRCGQLFVPHRLNREQRERGHVPRFCSKECYLGGRGPIPPRPHKRRGDPVWRVDPLTILRRDNWICHLCGKRAPAKLRGTTDDRAPEIDHILPVSQGGTHVSENLACAHRRCNRRKGRRPLGQTLLFG